MKASILCLLAGLLGSPAESQAGRMMRGPCSVQKPRALLVDQPSPLERHLWFLTRAGSLCEET